MARYTFENTETGEQQVVDVSYTAIKKWLDENPGWKRVFKAPEVNYRGAGGTGGMKNSPQFVETLQTAHRETPKSELDKTSSTLRKYGTGD